MPKEFWAYLAGLFDGEGCICIYKTPYKYGTHILEITISNTHLPTLKKLRAVLGGGILKKSMPPNKEWRQGYNWKTRHQHAGAILRAMLPYLSIKHAQARVAIGFCARTSYFLTRGRWRKGVRGRVAVLPKTEFARRDRMRKRIHKLNHLRH